MNDQLKSAYTECRAAKSACDLPEYCSGTDPLCPSDVYRRNTDSCTVNEVCQHFVSSLRMLRANPDSFSVAYLFHSEAKSDELHTFLNFGFFTLDTCIFVNCR